MMTKKQTKRKPGPNGDAFAAARINLTRDDPAEVREHFERLAAGWRGLAEGYRRDALQGLERLRSEGDAIRDALELERRVDEALERRAGAVHVVALGPGDLLAFADPTLARLANDLRAVVDRADEALSLGPSSDGMREALRCGYAAALARVRLEEYAVALGRKVRTGGRKGAKEATEARKLTKGDPADYQPSLDAVRAENPHWTQGAVWAEVAARFNVSAKTIQRRTIWTSS